MKKITTIKLSDKAYVETEHKNNVTLITYIHKALQRII